MTSSVTWPFDNPYAISDWWSFGTESLSPAVFEILRSNYSSHEFDLIQSCTPNSKPLAQIVFEVLRSKPIGVTSLTFQGHVTSSVT